jgi:hypothetical protein
MPTIGPKQQEEHMRNAMIGLAVMMTALPATVEVASAEARPWCLQAGRGGPGGGLPDCSYHTRQQCLAAVGGGTDGCFQNPSLAWDRIEGKRPKSGAQGGPRDRGY